MESINIIKENLGAIVSSKYGEWFDEDSDLGIGVFRSDKLSNVKVALYVKGFTYTYNSDNYKIEYEDIRSVDSAVSVQKYSEASRTGEYFKLYPLKIHCSDANYELMLPLIIYSGILITLNELIS